MPRKPAKTPENPVKPRLCLPVRTLKSMCCNHKVMMFWSEREVEVYRDLHTLLEERSHEADPEEQEVLDDVRDVVANMEADLTETLDDLEALRGEAVFDPEEYVQRFTYAGRRIKVVNQSSRLIVDMADADYLGEPYDVTLDDLDTAYCVLQAGISHRNDPLLGVGVDTVMRREHFGPSTNPDRETTERHLNEALTEAGYTHALIYGGTEDCLDTVLDLARTPLKDRPTEGRGYTVRFRERKQGGGLQV